MQDLKIPSSTHLPGNGARKELDVYYATCHLDLNFLSHDGYFVKFAPTTIHENKFAYVESEKISMLMYHEKNALCDSYFVEFIHDATQNYYERVIRLQRIYNL